MNLILPKALEVDRTLQAIRYDFRVILEIIEMLNDNDLEDVDKAEALVQMFYVNSEQIRNYQEAVQQCFRFIDHSDRKQSKKGPRLVDWEQDFDYIIAPVNRVFGCEAREIKYDPMNNTGGLHWWTFLGAYMEIGENSLFSQIVSIRDKRARGKKLEKYEREWYSRNADLVNLRQKFTASEESLLKEWM